MICIVWILILIALNGTSKSSRVLIPSHRVVVLGGGAAGYFAAIQCAFTLKSAKIDSEVIVEFYPIALLLVTASNEL